MSLENLIRVAEKAAQTKNTNEYHKAFAQYKKEITASKYDQMEAILCLKHAKYNWEHNPDTLFKDWFTQQLKTQQEKWAPLSLTEIVKKLISNIEQKAGTRCTSGLLTDKVEQLKKLDVTDVNEDHAIKQIMAICQIRRHRIHFWSEPASVGEFKDLLRTNDYSVPGEKLQFLDKK